MPSSFIVMIAALSVLASLLLLASVDGFTPAKIHTGFRRNVQVADVMRPHNRLRKAQDDDSMETADAPSNVLNGNTTRMSHVMLRTKHVPECVDFWKQQGGYVVSTGGNTDAKGPPKNTFITMGHSRQNNNPNDDTTTAKCAFDDTPTFRIEFANAPGDWTLGNNIRYMGVSMLLQFQNDLKGILQGSQSSTTLPTTDPNGIPVRSAASAPGDYLCRFAIATNDLAASLQFYETVLGMQCKAQDDAMICMRYAQDDGVPTTLVLEHTDDEIVHGTCLDHIVMDTTCDIEAVHATLDAAQCFLPPTRMFGRSVVGILDPNGYKIVLAN